MPWKNATQTDEITRFVMLARSDRFTITELCDQFGISLKTGDKHLERYALQGPKGRQSRSHRPHHFPQRTDEEIEALILAERRSHRTWGPKKLRRILERKHGLEAVPARSTMAKILRRHDEHDKPIVSPADYEVKLVSSCGQLAHEGENYHLGEAFAHKRVGLHLNREGQTALYFANVQLGTLAFEADRQYGPRAHVVPASRAAATEKKSDQSPHRRR